MQTKLELKFPDGLPEVLTYIDVAEALNYKTTASIQRLVRTGELKAVGISRSRRIVTKSFLEHLRRVQYRPELARTLNITTKEAGRIQRKAAQPLPPPRDSELEEPQQLQSQFPALCEVDPALIACLYHQGDSYSARGWQAPGVRPP